MKKTLLSFAVVITFLSSCNQAQPEPAAVSEVKSVEPEKVPVATVTTVSNAEPTFEILKDELVKQAIANLPERKQLRMAGPYHTGTSTTWSLESVTDEKMDNKVSVFWTDMLGNEALTITRKSVNGIVILQFQLNADKTVSTDGSKWIHSNGDTSILDKYYVAAHAKQYEI